MEVCSNSEALRNISGETLTIKVGNDCKDIANFTFVRASEYEEDVHCFFRGRCILMAERVIELCLDDD